MADDTPVRAQSADDVPPCAGCSSSLCADCREIRHEEQWAVFCGHPDDAEDVVDIFDDQATAEELAQRVIDAHIGYRQVTITEPAWRVLARCSGCGSVLDGELCCDARRADIEAGEAVLREALREAEGRAR